MAAGNIAISEAQTSVVELCIGYFLILVVIWTPRPWQRLSYFVAATYLITVIWRSRPGWLAMGLRTGNFVRSLWLVGVALLAGGVAVLVAARLHTLHTPGGPLMFVERYTGYALGACVQQILLQDFFLPRLLRLVRGPGLAAFGTAVMFSLAHLPNPILTIITLFWGFAACLFFLRYRNLYTLAIAHTILGITVAMSVPGPTIRNMRVGLGYLTYDSHGRHHRSH